MVVLTLHAHPDDIEFMMAGTALLLRKAGCTLHYCNLADGSMGTSEHPRAKIARIREAEAREAATVLGATWHPPIFPDLEILYGSESIARVATIIRRVKPDIILVPFPREYMEDHMNACRLAVTAAFVRGMRNFDSMPPVEPYEKEVHLYHAMPYGLTGPLREAITPHFYVDISSVIDEKERALACHQSQKRWLDESQGLNSYLETMREMSRSVGRMSGSAEYAEGWTRHSHLGFSTEEADPLAEMLSDVITEHKGGKG